MRAIARTCLFTLLALALGSCDSRTQQTDTGGVLLEVEFASDNIPAFVSVNNANEVLQVGTVNINSIVSNPDQGTSALMDVELEALEVSYVRVDGGTLVPPPYIFNLLGTVPVDGTLTYNNLPVMSVEQFRSRPLSDLLFENGGFDRETGQNFIRLNLIVRVFGRTLAGKEVESVARPHTVEFFQ